MKKFVALLCLVVLSVEGHPHTKRGLPKDSVISRKAKLIGDGSFITNSERVKGNTIHGQYSYKDPLGSLVVVKYTVDKDGSNYSEKRQLTVDYKSNNHVSKGSKKSNKVGIKFHDGFTDDEEVLDHLIVKLKPQIKQVLEEINSGDSSESDSSPTNFFSKRIEVVGGIICETIKSAGPIESRSEEEMISNLIFLVTQDLGIPLNARSLMQKLSRRIRETIEDATNSTSTEDETETSTTMSETTTETSDNSLDDIFGEAFSQLSSFASMFESIFSNETSSSNDDKSPFGDLFSSMSSGSMFSSTNESTSDNSGAIFENLFSLAMFYVNEAFCKKEEPKPSVELDDEDIIRPFRKEDSNSNEEIDEEIEEDISEDSNEEMKEMKEMKGSASIPQIISELRPIINATVSKVMMSVKNSDPTNDELLISNIQVQIQPLIIANIYKELSSDPELYLKHLESGLALLRSVIIEQIHNYRLEKQQQGDFSEVVPRGFPHQQQHQQNIVPSQSSNTGRGFDTDSNVYYKSQSHAYNY